MPKLGSVGEPWWDDKPLAIVGTGPSLKGFDLAWFKIAGVRVLAVKEAIWDLPFADCLFGLDRPWIIRQEEKLRSLATPKVFAVEPEFRPCPVIEGALYIMRSRFAGFSDDLSIIQSGGNSGFGAVNYAYLKRAKQIALFGFDYLPGPHYCQDRYYTQEGRGGFKPQTDDHNARYWVNWGSNFNDAKTQIQRAGIEIFNASPNSTVTAFPKCTIEQGLAWLTHLAHPSGSDSIREKPPPLP